MPEFSSLARTYHPLLSKILLEKAYSSYCDSSEQFEFSKKELHTAINKLLFEHYKGEARLKYELANYFKTEEYQAGFEIKVGKSRADFLAINGNTKCFEIKSERDNLSRLDKQLDDYLKVFEYVYAVTDYRNVSEIEKLAPKNCGIWIFENNRKVEIRPAKYSNTICPTYQVSLLTKVERTNVFKESDPIEIEEQFSPSEINVHFKNTLKKRYEKRWAFVKNEWNQILPFDLQFFFNQNISPELVYST